MVSIEITILWTEFMNMYFYIIICMYSTLNDLLKRHHSPLFNGPLAAQVHQQLELLRAGVGGPRFRTIGGCNFRRKNWSPNKSPVWRLGNVYHKLLVLPLNSRGGLVTLIASWSQLIVDDLQEWMVGCILRHFEDHNMHVYMKLEFNRIHNIVLRILYDYVIYIYIYIYTYSKEV